MTHAGQSPVVPAQFASAPTPNNSPTSSALAGEGAVRPTSAQSLTGSPSSAQPRPLKPPTVADPKGKGQGSSGTVQMFVSVLSSLGLVIALIVASAWLYRKAAPKITGALPKQVVQVLGRTPLAPRQQLVLLRLGSKLVLVSNLHGEVRTISEITDPLEVDRLAGLCEAAQPGSISESFRSVLHNMGRNG
jgi:flagellar biogenesis protein FliO